MKAFLRLLAICVIGLTMGFFIGMIAFAPRENLDVSMACPALQIQCYELSDVRRCDCLPKTHA